jgi:signal peptidase I
VSANQRVNATFLHATLVEPIVGTPLAASATPTDTSPQGRDICLQADAASGVPTIFRQPERRHQWLGILLGVVILLLFTLLLFKLTVQDYHIQGHSMEPTLHDQEYVLVNKTAYLFQPPARGDIIVFHYPLNPKEDYIKRIIAIPGDVISVHDETVIVDSSTLHEVYVNKDDPFNPFPSFNNHIVGPEQYFVMGDNRGNSSDSRLWGLVPRQNILGKAIITYWPLGENNLGLLPNNSNVFAKVHQ